ncbi:hypothetical protein MMC11_007932 [Xylographa trunciseda]|nr:hypothetical protein [Xylographa trunciseda]
MVKEQIQQLEELKVHHASEQVAQLQTQIAQIAAMIQTQPTSIQIPPGASPSYAAIAGTPPDSRPSNLSSPSSALTMTSRITDTLYCTVDIARVEEGGRNKTGPRTVRDAVEKTRRATEGRLTGGLQFFCDIKAPKNRQYFRGHRKRRIRITRLPLRRTEFALIFIRVFNFSYYRFKQPKPLE